MNWMKWMNSVSIAEKPSFVNGFAWDIFYEWGLIICICTLFTRKILHSFSVFWRIKCPILAYIFFASEETKKVESHVRAWDLAYMSLRILCIQQNHLPWLFILTIWWQNVKWKHFRWAASSIYLKFNVFSVIRNVFGHLLICWWVNLFVRVR